MPHKTTDDINLGERTLPEMIAKNARQSPDAVAIFSPANEFPPLTYAAFDRQIALTVASLHTMGLGQGDRVAIVLPNCPEMATAFIGVASACTAAPLNTAYRADEFEFYLTDLKAKAVIFLADTMFSDSAARAVAQALDILVIDLHKTPELGVGSFVLHAQSRAKGQLSVSVSAPAARSLNMVPAAMTDVALILHTSGTTSRPKIVPLTHANVLASAKNVSVALELKPSDCGLQLMPLFHIHGLIAGVLAPLSVGGKVFVTPGFNALKFFGWMKECRPTWYTAVPTMHQTILARAASNMDVIRDNPLRFLRSSSSSMPVQVIAELERVFQAPLIESYGMTEAAHQMASNPLPPALRVPGSVGIASGPDIAIMDNDGVLMGVNEIGEIVIRGENVTAGYENNAAVNAQAFTHGWFRTGDQGRLDPQGYLSLTGRLKEIINRGGEKVSPLEVDEILMDHPAVMQVVTFAMPHPKLGEEVAAAVVLREGHALNEQDLRAFAATRLADYKVPKKVIFMAEIPKGATGKLQRIGLAAKLGI